jgi:hypothetical protein
MNNEPKNVKLTQEELDELCLLLEELPYQRLRRTPTLFTAVTLLMGYRAGSIGYSEAPTAAPGAGAATTLPGTPAEPLEGVDIGSDGLSNPPPVPQPPRDGREYTLLNAFSLNQFDSLGAKGWRLVCQAQNGVFIFERKK